MRKESVVLINPPDPLPSYIYPTNRPPYDLLYIESLLHDHGVGVKYLDIHNQKIGRAEYCSLFAEMAAFYYVINTTGHHHDFRSYRVRRQHQKKEVEVQQIIREIKDFSPDSLIILVGETARVYPEEYADCGVDCILVDEPEYAMLEVLKKNVRRREELQEMRGGNYRSGNTFIRNDLRNTLRTLDELIPPRWDLLGGYFWDSVFRERREYIDLVGMRGCPHACSFCKSALSKKVLYHSPRYLLTQIELLFREFGYTDFFFRGAGYFDDRQRAKEMCEGLRRLEGITWKCNARVDHAERPVLKMMKSSGCSLVAYGVESVNQKTLEYVHKEIDIRTVVNAVTSAKEEDLKVAAYFILGLPFEGLLGQLRTIIFAVRSGIDLLYFNRYFSLFSDIGDKHTRVKDTWKRFVACAFLVIVSFLSKNKRVYYSKIRLGTFLPKRNTF